MIQFQKRYLIERLEHNETNAGHQHNAHTYSRHFQRHLYDESALSRFEFFTKPLYKCIKYRPYYPTQYQGIFVHYQNGFNFNTGKASAEFKEVHLTIPNIFYHTIH